MSTSKYNFSEITFERNIKKLFIFYTISDYLYPNKVNAIVRPAISLSVVRFILDKYLRCHQFLISKTLRNFAKLYKTLQNFTKLYTTLQNSTKLCKALRNLTIVYSRVSLTSWIWGLNCKRSFNKSYNLVEFFTSRDKLS